MRPLLSRAGVITLGSLLLIGVVRPEAVLGLEDPEDSPLFSRSRDQALAQFAFLDRLSEVGARADRTAPSDGEIIVVEGTRWHSLAADAMSGYGKGTTRDGSPTCDQSCRTPTCQGPSCGFTLCIYTCLDTCIASQCATALFAVSVPRPGEIQMSFNSSIYLWYTLQYCTNLSGNEWLTAANSLGSGSAMTYTHTNNASLSFYRLWIH